MKPPLGSGRYRDELENYQLGSVLRECALGADRSVLDRGEHALDRVRVRAKLSLRRRVMIRVAGLSALRRCQLSLPAVQQLG